MNRFEDACKSKIGSINFLLGTKNKICLELIAWIENVFDDVYNVDSWESYP